MSIVTKVLRGQPGKFYRISTKDRKGEWTEHLFRRGQLRQIRKFLADNQDKDLWWCPHGFTKNRALKENAEPPKLLYADLDEVDARDLGELMPTYAWESSPGRWQGIWTLTEGFMTEDLNERLTYHLGADKSGWDFTQLLRVPGSTNYKHKYSKPKVTLRWSDGPTYTVDQILELLPKKKQNTRVAGDAIAIYKKWERKFNGFIRQNLLKGKPKKGKRSVVLWKLINSVLEAGVSKDETFELIRASPWNKFAGRKNGDDRLRTELEKATTRHFRIIDDESDEPDDFSTEETAEDEEEEEYKFLCRSMAEVEEEDIDWLWYPYLAKGEVTILEGDPNLGKSYMAMMIAVAVCDGKSLPTVNGASPRIPMGKVAYFDIENSAGSVTKKRLKGNGLKNFHNYFQEEEPFSVDDEDTIERVYEAIEHLRPSLVVFDTINTYIGKADTHKASETAQALQSFRDIAKRYKCAVVIVRHLTKGKGAAMYRGQGSMAFTGQARVVMTCGRLPEEFETGDNTDSRVMAITKINIAKPPQALTFRIEALKRGRSKFVWGSFVDLNSDQILAHNPNEKPVKQLDMKEEMEKLFADLLKDGPVRKREVVGVAEARGLGKKRLVQRVAKDLGITSTMEGGKAFWSLPGQS